MKSGFYVFADGTRAFVDVDCEERWIRSMCEQNEQRYEAEERDEELYRLSLESMGVLDELEDPDPPSRRERPRGLLMDVEAPPQ